MTRLIAWTSFAAALLTGGLAHADRPKKKPVKPPVVEAPWSPRVTTTPLGITPVTLRELALDAQRERHDATVAAELSPGTASSQHAVTLATTPRPDGGVDAQIEVQRGRERTQMMRVYLDASEEIVLGSLELVDLDFDGWLDLRVIRATGARWVTYAVRLFDPKKGLFVETDLGKKMGLLPNLDPRRATQRIVSTTTGPHEQSHATYRIEAGELFLERHCMFKTSLGVGAVGTLVVRDRDGDRMRERRLVDAPLPPGFPASCDR